MKTLLFFITILICAAGFSQGFPQPQSLGSPNTIITYKGALAADSGIVNSRYADTATANLSRIKHYRGAQIITGDSVWMRNSSATRWILTSTTSSAVQAFNCNERVDGGSVTYVSGFSFAVASSTIRVDCIPYFIDSATVTLDTANDNYDRYDVIYADSTGVHVLEGTAEELAVVPPLEAGQIFLAWVRIPADAAAPDISQVFIYNENVEWTGAQSGATADFDNATNVYVGSKSINWTNVTNGDVITLTTGTEVDLRQYDAVSLAVKNKAALSDGSYLYIRWYNGTTPVSNELRLTINKQNISTYQTVSVPMSLFTLANNNINRLRIRYVSNLPAVTHSGFYLDNIFLEQGVQLPGGSGNNVSITMPPAFTVVDNNDAFSIIMGGTSGQYLKGDGTLGTFNAVTGVGTINSESKSLNGAVLDGSSIVMQTVDDDFPGLATVAMKKTVDTLNQLTVENLGDGYPLMVSIDALRTGFYNLVAGTGVAMDTLNGNITISASGGGGRFGVEDNDAAEDRNFDAGDHSFYITGNGENGSTTLERITDEGGGITRTQQIIISIDGTTRINSGRTTIGSSSYIQNEAQLAFLVYDSASSTTTGFGVNPDWVEFNTPNGVYTFANLPDSITDDDNYMLVWNDVTLQIYKAPLPSGEGGGGGGSGTVNTGAANRLAYYPSSGTTVDDLAAITANRALISDANGLPTHAATTATEIGYVNGVTSAIQTQLNAKASLTGAETLPNKRWVARVGSTTSSGTPTINTDNYDVYKITALAENITSFTTNLTGTPNDGDILVIEITGTATRSITWGSAFVDSTVELPTATDGTNTLTVVLRYSTTSSYGNNKWGCVNSY